MRLSVLADEFLRFCAVERQHSTHTIEAYTFDLKDFCGWLGRDTDVEDVTSATLQDYLRYLVEQRRLAPSSIRRRLACLRALFRRCADRNVASSPFVCWRPALPRRKKLPRSLSRVEASSLVEVARGASPKYTGTHSVFFTIVRFMIITGIRVGELCRLRPEDLSPDGSIVHVQGKGGRDRVVYITDVELRSDLAALLSERRKSNASFPTSLFSNSHGAPMRPHSVRTLLRKLGTKLGVPRRITPHMLRHTAATLLLESGAEP